MATEKRLIRLDDLMKFPIRIDHYDKENGNEHFVYGVETVLEYAENLPVVDAVEVVHGRWIDIYDGIYANPIYKCSVCGNSAPIEERYPVIGRMYTDWSFTNYCPNCGADMRGNGNG